MSCTLLTFTSKPVPLSSLPVGAHALVARRVATRDAARVERLLALGVTAGAVVTMLQTFPGVVFFCDQTELAVERAVADAILVRPDGGSAMTPSLRLVFWESTKACNLTCRHCRAVPQKTLGPTELRTAEAFDLIDQIAKVAKPVFVLSGGEPLFRPGPVRHRRLRRRVRLPDGARDQRHAGHRTGRRAHRRHRLLARRDQPRRRRAGDPRRVPRPARIARARAARPAQPARRRRLGPDQLDDRQAQRQRAAGAARPRARDRRRRAAPVHAGAGRLRPRDRAERDAAGRRVRARAALVRRAVEDLPDRPEGDLRAALLPHPRAAARERPPQRRHERHLHRPGHARQGGAVAAPRRRPRTAPVGDDARLPGRHRGLLHLERRRRLSVRLSAGQRRQHARAARSRTSGTTRRSSSSSAIRTRSKESAASAAIRRCAAAAAPAPTPRPEAFSPRSRSARIDPISKHRVASQEDISHDRHVSRLSSFALSLRRAHDRRRAGACAAAALRPERSKRRTAASSSASSASPGPTATSASISTSRPRPAPSSRSISDRRCSSA